MRQRPTPKRSTGSRNTPARQARLQKLTKGTTDTISSLRGAMGFTPKRSGSASGTRREQHLLLLLRVQAGSATPVATPSLQKQARPTATQTSGRNTPAKRSHLRLRKG
jgi:hypothetical protein